VTDVLIPAGSAVTTPATVKKSPRATPAPAITAAARVAALPSRSELSEELRGQLPALNITGSLYSDEPNQRLLFINNQVVPQGSQVAAGVKLEEIHPHTVVFSFQDVRFRVSY
jgi:general secretion pathway protein B